MSAYIATTADEAINQFFHREPQKRDTIDLNKDLLYVLHLVNGKFYVGRSKQFRKRLKAHYYRKSRWTKKYPPVEVLDLIQPVEDFDEDKITLRYMNQFGIDNVRGGSFSSIELDPDHEKVITHMCMHARGGCFSCGNEGHFAKDCPVKPFEQYSTSRDSALYRIVRDALRRRRRECEGFVRSRGPRPRRDDIDFNDSDADYDSDDLYDYFDSADFDNSDDDSDDFDDDSDDFYDDSDDFDDDSDDFDDDSDDYSSDYDDDYDRPSKRRKRTQCSCCGRDSHTKSECYATFDIDGCEIRSRSSKRRGQSAKTPAVAATVAAAVAAPSLSSFFADARPMHAAEAATSLASRSSSTSCDRCGRMSHTTTRCYATTSVGGHPLTARSPTRHLPPQPLGVPLAGAVGSHSVTAAIASIQPPTLLTSPSRAAAPAPSQRCARCGRDSHTQSRCFASTSVDGRALTADPPATSRPEMGFGNVFPQAATGHHPLHTAAAVAANPSSRPPPSQHPQPSRPPQFSPYGGCRRCGRDSHTQNQCYASTHVSGRYL